jgi:uncharacterized protein
MSTQTRAVPHRTLGKTGLQVSVLGIGGYHLGLAKDQSEATRIVRESMESGVNFFDNAWEYHDGMSEDRMGIALSGVRRGAILMTKVCTHGRGRDLAMRMLEESLRRLKTDYLDIWQIHEVIYANDPEMIFRADGVAEALTQARKDGKVRFVGFTGHKSPEIFLKMLAQGFPFDTLLMPTNLLDATYCSFEKAVLPEANRLGLGAMGMKSLGGSGEIVRSGAATAEECLRYAMSLPIATLVSGIDSIKVLHQNLEVACGFELLAESEMQALRERTKSFAAEGRFEIFKSTRRYDGPSGRMQHPDPVAQPA